MDSMKKICTVLGCNIGDMIHPGKENGEKDELKDIQIAIYIFNTVDEEWDRRVQEKEVPDYSIVRTTLYESLVYRVFLGLNKIFAASKECSLRKATNQAEQLFRDNKGITKIIAEIRQKLDDSCWLE